MNRLHCATALVFAALAAAGCGKKDDAATVAPAASALVASKAESPSTAWHFVVDPQGTTHTDMPGIEEHITADTTAAAGSLDITPKDLTQSRGILRIDLATFSTHTFHSDKDEKQTEHARTWR